MPADYQYDVFFSYKRDSRSADWMKRVQSTFEYWLSEELGRPALVFIDSSEIEAGDRWPTRLHQALKSSRCMVGVWTPAYFQSKWCHSEWKSFRAREDLLGLNSHGLIAPLRYHDGEHFPEEARAVQWTDVAPYNSTMPAFWAGQGAVDLEDTLKGFVKKVARMVGAAPAFQNWPVHEAEGFAAPRIGLSRL